MMIRLLVSELTEFFVLTCFLPSIECGLRMTPPPFKIFSPFLNSYPRTPRETKVAAALAKRKPTKKLGVAVAKKFF